MAEDTSALSALVGQLLARVDSFNDMKSQVSALGGQVAILGDSVCKLQETVLGNGKPGHTTRLHDVEVRLEGMKNNGDRLRDVEEDVRDLKDWHAEWKKEREDQRKEMQGIRNTLMVSVAMLIITTVVNIFIK
jgi:hypothetical protein